MNPCRGEKRERPDLTTTVLRDARELRVPSSAPPRTEAIGALLGRRLQPGDVICLSGTLGAGKTVFSRGIGKGWGALPDLTSPTYNLAHMHRRARDEGRLAHIDLYRISGTSEADTLGLDDLLDGEHIVIMEWPERIREALPPAHLWINFELADAEGRELVLRAQGSRFTALMDALQRDLETSG